MLLTMPWIAWVVIAYFAGSIPFGVLLARSKGIDIRSVGSGNTGATNVGRTLGWNFGILCFLLDAAKGSVPVLLAGWSQGALGEGLSTLQPTSAWWWLAVAAAAILGHCFSPWLGFRGGKGVAAAFGGMLSMWPVLTVPVLIALGVWAAFLITTRLMSLASMAGALALPVAILIPTIQNNDFAPAIPFLVVSTLLAVFVIFRHRANIVRIIAGEEPKA
ncbi:MAG: glycerol-3-phosphate 1-O-acyltransferase PlsY [Phycisphaerales bacterium]|nr:glycerol-3-phosphate 1-O-acyltransferase PlsY [Phycisphaerales bacterium]